MTLVLERTEVTLITVQTEEEARQDFFEEHATGAHKDLRDAKHHARNGKYRLVITPARVALRRSDSSCINMDLESNECFQTRWLKSLYKSLCPRGMVVHFGYEKQLNAACGDHLEDVFMLVVNFEFT